MVLLSIRMKSEVSFSSSASCSLYHPSCIVPQTPLLTDRQQFPEPLNYVCPWWTLSWDSHRRQRTFRGQQRRCCSPRGINLFSILCQNDSVKNICGVLSSCSTWPLRSQGGHHTWRKAHSPKDNTTESNTLLKIKVTMSAFHGMPIKPYTGCTTTGLPQLLTFWLPLGFSKVEYVYS